MNKKPIGRRNALKYFGLISGSAAGSQFLANWLPRCSEALAASCRSEMASMAAAPPAAPSQASTKPYPPRFFTADEFHTLEILTELIIPTDDQQGAKEAHVAEYIDFLVFSAAEYEPSIQKEWLGGLKELDRETHQKYGNPFLQLSASEREKILVDMSLPERDPKAKHPGFPFYRLLKSTTVDTFYSSRVGLIDVLEYKGLTFLTSFSGCTSPHGKR